MISSWSAISEKGKRHTATDHRKYWQTFVKFVFLSKTAMWVSHDIDNNRQRALRFFKNMWCVYTMGPRRFRNSVHCVSALPIAHSARIISLPISGWHGYVWKIRTGVYVEQSAMSSSYDLVWRWFRDSMFWFVHELITAFRYFLPMFRPQNDIQYNQACLRK